MASPAITRRLLWVAMLCVLTLLVSCGHEDEPARRAPTPEEAPPPRAVPEEAPPPASTEAGAHPESPEEAPAVDLAKREAGSRAREEDAALQGLESEDRGVRKTSVAWLLEHGFTYRDLTYLGFRAARYERDVGLLADLLAGHTDDVLPVVLQRMAHSAPLHRARICTALGRPRRERDAAIAVLLVRALFDEFEGAREAARLAVGRLLPAGPLIVQEHYRQLPACADGAVRRLIPHLILGPAPRAAYVERLLQVLRSEAGSAGPRESFAVADLLYAIGLRGFGGKEMVALLLSDGVEGPGTEALLARDPAGWVDRLRQCVRDGERVDLALGALTRMGATARAAVPDVLAALRRTKRPRLALGALRAIGGDSDEIEVALFDALVDPTWRPGPSQGEPRDAGSGTAGRPGSASGGGSGMGSRRGSGSYEPWDPQGDVLVMLQVLRPGKALLDRFAGMLESRVYAWQILLLLPWCEADQRDRARRLVATFEAEHRVPTHARRIWIEQAKKGLARTEAETRAARRSLEVRESWLAVPR